MQLFENTNYVVEIGPSIEDGIKGDVYKVRNKISDIIETESRLLPQAIKYAIDLEEALNQITGDEGDDKPSNLLVPARIVN